MQTHTKTRLRPVAGASGRAAILELADGPPDIQTETVLAKDGTIIRDPTVTRSDWRDPDDADAHRKKTGARTIHGYRRVWTILSLHGSSPSEITEQHVKAAVVLLGDYERSLGAACGRDPTIAPVDNGRAEEGPEERRIRAAQRYEAALCAVGLEGSVLVFHIAIMNRTVTEMAAQWGVSRDRLHGRLCGALGRLAEFYWPPTQRSIASQMPLMAILDGLPAERFGRWKETTP